MKTLTKAITLLGCTVIVASCSGARIDNSSVPKTIKERRRERDGKLFGDSLTFGDRTRSELGANGGGSGIGVNAHLWYASLDTISFMPLASADPFGGVIVTDWYTPAISPQERFKVNVFILDRLLRSDAIRVSVFSQKWDPKTHQWITMPADTKMAADLENIILTRARQLRINSVKS